MVRQQARKCALIARRATLVELKQPEGQVIELRKRSLGSYDTFASQHIGSRPQTELHRRLLRQSDALLETIGEQRYRPVQTADKALTQALAGFGKQRKTVDFSQNIRKKT